MEQLIFKFPFSKKYFEQDFFVSSNNFSAFKLIEEWPTWPGKWLNIFGESGSGKTHLAKILEKKINNTKLIDAKDIDNEVVQEMVNFDCLIIDSFKNDIDEKLLYSILNQSKRFENYVLIISTLSIKEKKFKLNDLQSRMNSFLYFGIELPTDDLLKVIISKTLSEKQININPKILDFILNNVERSYDKMFKFLKDLDELSLSTGKSININLIKKALNQ
ncbi:MAG: DNA replication protein [Pelagibacteraceae bacterium]|jgi:chromosomal replication initiation ATPase DnaA|nr:DNA replication protein [Pelagibacteraceae bacterium]